MSSAKQGSLKYELLLFVMAMIWGSAFAAQQIGMDRGVTPMAFNALRFALGAIVLIPVMLIRRRATTQSPPSHLPIGGSILAGFFMFAAAGTQQIGLQYTSCANAGFITSLYIVFVPLIGLFFNHKVNKSLWLGLLVCVAGLYLLSIKGDMTISLGDGLVLICALLWAGQILVIDHVVTAGDPLKIAFVQFVVCALLSLVATVTFESCQSDAILAGAAPVAYAGIMSVGIAFTLQVFCQKKCPPAPAAVIMGLEAVFAAIAGYVVLGQSLTARAITGCCLIFAGVLIVQLVPIFACKSKRSAPAVTASAGT